jgi:hypothetical protein
MKPFFLCAALMMPGALCGQVSPEIVITEIFADPSPPVGLPDAEFVEVMNRSSNPVSLSGWTIYEGSSRTLPAMTLLPGEYLIICANSDTAIFSPYGKVAGVSSFSLTNTGEKVAIRNPQGQVVDSLFYSDEWFGSSFKKDGGWSLERMDADFTCHDNDNWMPSVNLAGGTPGAVNSVAGTFTDLTPPMLWRAYCPDNLSVMLVFSEPIDPNGVGDVQNYSLSGGLQIQQPGFWDASNTRILLILSTPVQPQQIYSVKVKNLHDCAGNEAVHPMPVLFGLADLDDARNVVINEILFDPFSGGYDFVELFHNGNRIVDLKQLRIASYDYTSGEMKSLQPVTDESFLMLPGDYVVLTEKPEIVSASYRSSFPYGFVTMNTLPSMNVDEGHVGIIADSTVTDQFRYSDEMHFELLNSTDGISLEKVHPTRSSSDPTAWHSCSPSAGFATPGLRNSVFSDSPQRNREVTIQPEIFSPDNDGFDDLITFSINNNNPGSIGNIVLYNSTGQIIYTHRYNKLLASADAFTWNGINDQGSIVTPGIYVAILEVFTLDGNVDYYKMPFVVARK